MKLLINTFFLLLFPYLMCVEAFYYYKNSQILYKADNIRTDDDLERCDNEAPQTGVFKND